MNERPDSEGKVQTYVERAVKAFEEGQYDDMRVHVLDALGMLPETAVDTRLRLHMLLCLSPMGVMKKADFEHAIQDARSVIADRTPYDELCRHYELDGENEVEKRIARSRYMQAQSLYFLLTSPDERDIDAEWQEVRALHTAERLLGRADVSRQDAVNAHLFLLQHLEDFERIRLHLEALEHVQPQPAVLTMAHAAVSNGYHMHDGLRGINHVLEQVRDPHLRADILLKKLNVLNAMIPCHREPSNEDMFAIISAMDGVIADLEAIPEAKEHRAWVRLFQTLLALREDNDFLACRNFRIAERLAGMYDMEDLHKELQSLSSHIEHIEAQWWEEREEMLEEDEEDSDDDFLEPDDNKEGEEWKGGGYQEDLGEAW